MKATPTALQSLRLLLKEIKQVFDKVKKNFQIGLTLPELPAILFLVLVDEKKKKEKKRECQQCLGIKPNAPPEFRNTRRIIGRECSLGEKQG